ncbi:MAG TPA: thiolase family protein [Spirochaetota bacterium]|nr:thiolase family protein [Spirochaetota bacterium]HRZ26856.1 thiolase family protein [Spirochaetota bacterium]HSA15152.1 thiolase family protein [Spirochaetota bacterium]
MRDVYIIGADTIRFGKYLDKTIPELSAQTVFPCLRDAGLEKNDIQAIYFANSAWGEYRRQVCIRGQVALRPIGIDAIPIFNMENACAGGSTAFHHAWLGVASGLYDITMALGAEKIYDSNQKLVFSSFLTGLDVGNILEMMRNFNQYGMTDADREAMKKHLEKYAAKEVRRGGKKKTVKSRWKDFRDGFAVAVRIGETMGYDVLKELRRMGGGDHSPFMDVYGHEARRHMEKYGTTIEQLAHIASKNHFHSTMNPNAQYQFPVPVDQVLADRLVTWPLTRSMCAPVGDGAASAILCDEKTVKKLGLMSRAVKVLASIPGSGRAREAGEPDIGARLVSLAYARAGVGPDDIDLAEVHDASAYGELHQTENMGFCREGEGGILAMSGETRIGGRIPVNTSGGLESRGHPIGASGIGQIHEIVTQLRGNAGKRQVEGARIGLAENGGGALGVEEAAMCIHILEAPSKKKK